MSSASNANQSVALSSPNKEVQKTVPKTVSKTREEYIREVFEVLPKVEGFPLSSEELMTYFTRAVTMKDGNGKKLHSIRAFSSKKIGDDGPKKPPRVSGYNIFIREFKDAIPEGVEAMAHKGTVWGTLSDEAKKPYTEKANQENLANGIQPVEKKKQPTLEERTLQWEIEWKQWCCADPESRGDEPQRPKAKERTKSKPKPKPESTSSSESEEN